MAGPPLGGRRADPAPTRSHMPPRPAHRWRRGGGARWVCGLDLATALCGCRSTTAARARRSSQSGSTAARRPRAFPVAPPYYKPPSDCPRTLWILSALIIEPRETRHGPSGPTRHDLGLRKRASRFSAPRNEFAALCGWSERHARGLHAPAQHGCRPPLAERADSARDPGGPPTQELRRPTAPWLASKRCGGVQRRTHASSAAAARRTSWPASSPTAASGGPSWPGWVRASWSS